jgi:hypothetical protein
MVYIGFTLCEVAVTSHCDLLLEVPRGADSDLFPFRVRFPTLLPPTLLLHWFVMHMNT